MFYYTLLVFRVLAAATSSVREFHGCFLLIFKDVERSLYPRFQSLCQNPPTTSSNRGSFAAIEGRPALKFIFKNLFRFWRISSPLLNDSARKAREARLELK